MTEPPDAGSAVPVAAGPADLAVRAAATAVRAARGTAGAPGGAPAVALQQAVRTLRRLSRRQPEPDLAAWAQRLAADAGDVPLLGASGAAAPGPGLQWNGEHARRAGLPRGAGLALVAIVAGVPDDADAGRLAAALQAGLAVAGLLDRELGRTGKAAAVTTDVIAAAACAALVADPDRSDLPAVLDLAGSLLVVAPAGPLDPTPGRLPWGGHALAAGWLAGQCVAAGLVGLGGGLTHTLTVLGAGTVPGVPDRPPDVAVTAGPPHRTARALLGALR